MTRTMEKLIEMEGTPPTVEELQENPLDVFYDIARFGKAFGAKRPDDIPEDSDEPLSTI